MIAFCKTKTKSKPLTFHPACLAFPELPKDELQSLAADIKKHGLLNAITLLNNQILEGRSRYKACKIAGVEPHFVEWAGTGSPTEWVISQNLIRRHLTSSQRAVVALELLPLLEAEAKDRQRLSCGRGKKGVKKSSNSTTNGRATETAARMTHSNFSYVAAAKDIKEHAPELLDGVRDGRLSIPEAKMLAKLPRPQRNGIMRQIERGQLANGSVREMIGRMTDIPQDRPAKYGFRGSGSYTTDPKPNTIQTPHGVCRFLYDLISPHYKVRTILDPSSGAGALTKPWKGRKVISFESTRGQDFFACPDHVDCDLVLCNPPFNNETGEGRAFLPQSFLERILKTVASKTPIVLVTPMGMRLNQRMTSVRWRWLRDHCPAITSIISLPLDIFENVLFHSEVLLFNMPKLKPHYFLPERYLR